VHSGQRLDRLLRRQHGLLLRQLVEQRHDESLLERRDVRLGLVEELLLLREHFVGRPGSERHEPDVVQLIQ
jgi:hypothetical protein